MADLFGTPATPPPSSNQEDISFSSFFQALHDSSTVTTTTASSSPCMTQFINSGTLPSPENMAATAQLEGGQGFCRSRGASQGESSTGLNVNFPDPDGVFFKENIENAFFSVLDSDSNASCNSEKGPEASKVPSNPLRPRSSSKRGRAAEVHNLTEKRRRSRINEKMKALQSLIPNSNKTDKASMLDDAIEYLKQLQLQVQMLTLRNGSGLPPMCLSGAMPPLQLGRDAENILLNRGTGIVHAHQQGSLQTFYGLPNLCTPPCQPPGETSLADMHNAETSYGFELPLQAQFEQLNPPNSSKEICRQNLSSQVQVDTDQCSNSLSGVS